MSSQDALPLARYMLHKADRIHMSFVLLRSPEHLVSGRRGAGIGNSDDAASDLLC